MSSVPYVGDIIFVRDCPACHREIKASGTIALDAAFAKHFAICAPKVAKRIQANAVEAAQGKLF